MAGLVEKLQKMWNPPDDEYDDYSVSYTHLTLPTN